MIITPLLSTRHDDRFGAPGQSRAHGGEPAARHDPLVTPSALAQALRKEKRKGRS
jgi:hypothetical protein